MLFVFRKKNVLLIVLVALFVVSLLSYNIFGVMASKIPVDNKILHGKVIIDAGHGGEDPGAVSDYSGAVEKKINLTIAQNIKTLLEKDGFEVIMTREDDVLQYDSSAKGLFQKRKQDLTRRREVIDSSGALAMVSIHLNKFPQTQYSGAQTFYPMNHPESQRLALAIQDSLKKSVDPQNKREPQEKNKKGEIPILLKEVKIPSTIVECGFLSNKEDESKLIQESYQQLLVTAIYDGIKVFLSKKTQAFN